MGSLERRIEALEGRWGLDEDPEAGQQRTEEKRQRVIAHVERILAQIEDEERENPSAASRRRAALKDLQESVERRRREE
jgi:hypothetical protein